MTFAHVFKSILFVALSGDLLGAWTTSMSPDILMFHRVVGPCQVVVLLGLLEISLNDSAERVPIHNRRIPLFMLFELMLRLGTEPLGLRVVDVVDMVLLLIISVASVRR